VISFRYHLVSIVAVFLALALGVLVGTTVVNQGVIDDLNRRTEAASRRADALRNQLSDLETQISEWNRFGDVVLPTLIGGQLTSKQVVMVTIEGVDVAEVDDVRQALEDSGASVVAVLVITPRMAMPNDSARTDLAALVGATATDSADTVSMDAAQRIGARLAGGPAAGADDVLQQMVSGGFIALLGGTGLTGGVGAGGQAVVMLTGGSGQPAVSPEAFLVPMVASLVTASQTVVAAETSDSAYPFVPLIRTDRSLDGHLVTVDDADLLPGRIALVLGLRDMFRSPGTGGDYGIKAGASGGAAPNP
jgi:hypothetical protein